MASYARAMIELRADVELKDTIMVAMPKLVGEGFYMCTIVVEYEWKRPKCSSCKVFGHILDECPKNIVSDVMKNLKNPRQASRVVYVGPNVGFKPTKQVYRPVSNKNNANTSTGKKKQDKVSRKEINNSNPFDAINSVENDDDFGTNGGNSKSAGKGANSGIQVIDGKLTFVDNDDKPLAKVVSMVNEDSNSEVEDVVNEHAVFMASTSLKSGNDSGYGTNSLLEQ
ncbi:hypothetical protein Tco_1308152 [Tanacetum coccineum]